MASGADANSSTLGTLSIRPFLSVSSAPQILFEWVALIPLVIYLSTYRHSYKLVGKTALGCSLGVALFPKLGILTTIADLLEGGQESLDQACSVSERRENVWDANFGGRFPCANGAASEIITKSVMQRNPDAITMPDTLPRPRITLPDQKYFATSKAATLPQFRRYQTLRVLHCTYKQAAPDLNQQLYTIFTHRIARLGLFLVLLGASIVSCLFGLYGTGAAVLISAMFHLFRQAIHVNRPDTYLQNTEFDQAMGCMLAGIHENASTWTLYIGDRGIIDSLLNKPMILSITTVGGAMGTKYLAFFLRLLALLQLLAMTFVAAQKGWDGVGMLVLVVLAWASDLLIYGDKQLTERWLSSENINIEAKSFQFSGRAIMIGAIQGFKDSPVERWMDDILALSERRTVWLNRLQLRGDTPERNIDEDSLSMFDKEWVERNAYLSNRAVEILRREFPKL